MPAYNARRWVHGAVRSIQLQTYRDWELIVCDDGSQDGTPEYVARLAAEDPRIVLVQSEHRGLVSALNTAFGRASGELIARMDADDLSLPQRLERQVALLDSSPELWVVGCLVRCFPRRLLPEGMMRYEAWLNSLTTHDEIVRDFFVESPFAHPSVLMRRSALEAAGGYRDVGWPEDYDLWMRMLLQGGRFAKVPEVLFCWRDHRERLTRTARAYSMTAFRSLKIHYLRQWFLKGVDAVQVWSAGHSGRNWARDLQAHGLKVLRFIDIDPAKIGTMVRGVPVISVEELPSFGRDPILVCIGVRGARQIIRERLDAMGLREGVDYLCVA